MNRQEFCKVRFEAYLRQRSSVTEQIEWQEGPDPPDYYLIVGNQKYAVEVTSIAEKIDIGSGKEMEREKLVGYRKSLVAKVESEAKTQGILRGRYVVTFDSLLPPSFNLPEQSQKIKCALLKYIQETQDVETAPERRIPESGITLCSIRKKSLSPSQEVDVLFEPCSFWWEGEAVAKACEWLESAIKKKADRLEGADQRLGIELPKILLILHDFSAVDFTVYKCCKPCQENLQSYHTVAIVSEFRDQGVFVLHTVNKTWRD